MNLVQMFSTLSRRNMHVFDSLLLWHRAESAGGCWGQVQCRPTSLCRLCVWYVILIVSIQYSMTCQQVFMLYTLACMFSDVSVELMCFFCISPGDSTCGQRAIYHGLGLSGIPIINVNNNCSTGSTALFMARQLIQGGEKATKVYYRRSSVIYLFLK